MLMLVQRDSKKRPKKSSLIVYTAQPRITRNSKTVHSESQPSERMKLAASLMNKRESDPEPGGPARQPGNRNAGRRFIHYIRENAACYEMWDVEACEIAFPLRFVGQLAFWV